MPKHCLTCKWEPEWEGEEPHFVGWCRENYPRPFCTKKAEVHKIRQGKGFCFTSFADGRLIGDCPAYAEKGE